MVSVNDKPAAFAHRWTSVVFGRDNTGGPRGVGISERQWIASTLPPGRNTCAALCTS